MLTSDQVRAARALLRWDQATLAKSADISVETIKRLEAMQGELRETRTATVAAIQEALEAAGVEFIQENGGGVGLRFRERAKPAKRVR